MIKMRKTGLFLFLCLMIVFALLSFSSIQVAGQKDAFTDIQEKITGVSEEERIVLEKLFILVQQTDEMEKKEMEINQEILQSKGEVQTLEGLMANEEASYKNKREILRQVLKSYQRRGPGSYLEIILSADSLSALLRSINTMRDLTRNTGKLLDSLEESKEKLAGEKTKLDKKLMLIEEKKMDLEEALAKKIELKEAKEKYLATLLEKGETYRAHLTLIEAEWDELKNIFPHLVRGVSQIIEKGALEGKLPADAVKISFSLTSMKGTIEEDAFNQIITGYTSLPQFTVRFQLGKIDIRLANKNLILTGTFTIIDGKILKFEAKEGSFYGLPLKTGAIDELFREGQLLFNLEPLLGGTILRGIEIQDGYIALEVQRDQ